ncbi:hypothetical protein HN371_03430 [Candidatus Poribacteria bacterium]|jgi:hypothetical protein|nr:hypothetical protein [Candidatus Poribacteria bacterium]MBT5712963.1 hypothetical protein [Candidatus Poribacteria bacterium]MBT7100225.1 hypothetical protein [Candidatus Poribacteria bacterium]MBT7808444.1 hypothetical protein [Candidatus Poribacteria bacterium]
MAEWLMWNVFILLLVGSLAPPLFSYLTKRRLLLPLQRQLGDMEDHLSRITAQLDAMDERVADLTLAVDDATRPSLDGDTT